MPFDVAGAKAAGYTDAEIADHLGQGSSFDVAGARKAGYNDGEILQHLTAAPDPSANASTDEPSFLRDVVGKTATDIYEGAKADVRGAGKLAEGFLDPTGIFGATLRGEDVQNTYSHFLPSSLPEAGQQAVAGLKATVDPYVQMVTDPATAFSGENLVPTLANLGMLAGMAGGVKGAVRPAAEVKPWQARFPVKEAAPEVKPGFDPYAPEPAATPAPVEVPRGTAPAPETVTVVKPDVIPQTAAPEVPKVGESAPVQSVAKEPWQMTREDYNKKNNVHYHQTSKAAEKAILEQGYSLDHPLARRGDEQMPDAVFLKPHNSDISVGASGADAVQMEASVKSGNIRTFQSRDELARFLHEDAEYSDLAYATNEADRAAAKALGDLEKRMSSERLSNEQIDLEMEKASEPFYEAATKARRRATELLKQQGIDGIVIKSDPGFLGRQTETMAILNPENVTFYPHKAIIKKALSEGKPVPPEVLAEYPDLAAIPNFDATMKATDFQNRAGGNMPVGTRPLPRTAETLVSKMEVPRATSAATEAIVRNNMDLYDNIAAKTVDQITAEGRDKGLTMDDIRRDFDKEGVIYNDYQTRSLGEMATAVTDDMVKRWADMTKEEQIAALENAIYANMSYLKVGTEQGRALRMRAEKINPEGVLEAEAFRSLMRKLKKEGFGEEEIKRTLDGVDLSKPEEVLRKIQELNKPTVGDMVFEAWSNMLLGNPVTQASNIVGNIGGLSFKAPVRTLAGTFDAASSLFTGKPRTVYASEGYRMATSLIQGVKEGGQRAVYSWVNEMTMGDASKLEVRSRTAIPGKLGKVVRAPGYRPLTFMDEFFKGIIGAGERNALAYREAMKEGLKGDALKRRVMELNEQPTAKMIQAINKEQTHWTYQDELGKTGRALSGIRNKIPGARYIMPFVKTAINLTKMGTVELTPAGYVRVAGKILYGKENGFFEQYGGKAQVLEDLSKATIGSVLTTMVVQQAFEGNITGNGPKDKNQRGALMATGWRPQSFKVGDNYVSYARIEPFATLLGITADLTEAFKMYQGGESDKIAGKLSMAWGRGILNKTMMQGINSFSQALADPEQFGDKWIQGMLGTLVPSAVNQIAKADDPYIREVNSWLDAIYNRLPVMKEGLPMRFDVWGRPLIRQNVENKTGNFMVNLLSPITVSKISRDPVDAEMTRIQMFKGQPSRTIEIGNEKRKLDDKEYEQYARVTGQQAYYRVSALIQTEGYRDMPDEYKKKIIDNIVDGQRKSYRMQHFRQ